MFNPSLDLYQSRRNISKTSFDIVQIGAGGNGGYLTQRLSKMINSFSRARSNILFRYCIVDGDRFEEKNLQRQPCIEEDLGLPKSRVLSERYGNVYDIPIFYKDTYVESSQEIGECFGLYTTGAFDVRVLIGCVDNHATRKLMHQYFMNYNDGLLVYIDSGVDSVLTEGTEEEIASSGYSGHVVCGVKLKTSFTQSRVVLDPVGLVYPDILEDKDSKLPSQSCGDVVVDQPQRMQTNELAALVIASYLNTMFDTGTLESHMTNFNAKTMLCRPVYLTKEQTA